MKIRINYANPSQSLHTPACPKPLPTARSRERGKFKSPVSRKSRPRCSRGSRARKASPGADKSDEGAASGGERGQIKRRRLRAPASFPFTLTCAPQAASDLSPRAARTCMLQQSTRKFRGNGTALTHTHMRT